MFFQIYTQIEKEIQLKLSIIIVNYKVPQFLEQCLFSVYNATAKLKSELSFKSEIIVVDNNSEDNSVEMIKTKYPKVILIKNKDNQGFSKANNTGFKISKGNYILLLNPDTLVSEDLFTSIIPYADKNTKAGAIGVQLTDANGNFQPESKRQYPTPARSFSKLFGLANLFPNSKKFNSYINSQTDPDKIFTTEILSGAFMFIRRSAAEKTKLLDESFFMYGEDIDLSYRILQAGYENIYFGKKKVLHYKGESTKTDSHRYISVFYNAMHIFSRKHFTKNRPVLGIFLSSGIFLRSSLAHLFLSIKTLGKKIKYKKHNSSTTKMILIIGNESSKKDIAQIYNSNNSEYNIQASFSPSTKDSHEQNCKKIYQITEELNINEIVVDIRFHKVSCLFCLHKMLSEKNINFYTISQNRSELLP